LPWQREFPDNTAKDVEDGEEGTRGRCGGRVRRGGVGQREERVTPCDPRETEAVVSKNRNVVSRNSIEL